MPRTIGFIGLGIMGLSMARRLIEAGHNRAERQGKEITLCASPSTLIGDRIRQFPELVDNDH